MKAELQAKYIQFLNKKNQDSNKGFTLIELLVVIIIIGILAAIALPNFLNQSAKAKQSEAKTTISSVNSAQTAYRQENASFADTMAKLALGLPTKTVSYEYSITGIADLGTIDAATTDTALKGFSGGTARINNANSESVINSVVCEATAAGGDATPPTAPAAGSDGVVCPSGTKNIATGQ